MGLAKLLLFQIPALLVGFALGSILWSAGTGAVAGLLDAFGIHLSGALLISLSPIGGILGSVGFLRWLS